MKTWGFGIIGTGSIADFHAAAIKELASGKLVAAANRTEARAKAFADKEGCGYATDYKELLANPDIDIVCVTTSSGSHAAIGLDVLNAGKHLVVEKPIAMNTKQSLELIRAAKRNGVTLSVISQRRFEKQHVAVREALDGGALGKLLLVEVSLPFYRTQAYYDSAEWRGTIEQDGGALMNQGIHSIDLLLWFGGAVETVYGKTATQTHDMEAEDIGLALLTFKNGAFGTIMASTSIQPGFQAALNLYGEKGTIKLEGSSIAHWTVPGVEQPELGVHTGYGGVSDPRSISHVYHRTQLENVIESIESGKELLLKGIDGLRAVQLVEAIYESSAKGAPVRIEEVAE
ncbi:Gfo/Idh/MocA family protein [Paenibacillus flagellatus]|uniref:Gfo/Idh/MocA family oxidoreductase n=1 Tax=Paenibacillus flagellatus TaxID=2211139 RepID=A0A2V5JZ75_9BACL|nr:Gfo/Idh/MocA family oxidoreductase [Paenibacillus flagellatus]PYI52138.1 gfo/Idh/MocA family oxidoreductase [Paenibacillus flagellatus]